MMSLLVLSAVITMLLPYADAYPGYQQQIPNGAIVPNPCNMSEIWGGVGHQNKQGAGPRNPFGNEFQNNGHTWTRSLCMADSDGDGRTNGQELGDPYCTWTPGNTPYTSTGLSHPGICEPMNSSNCQITNMWLMNCNPPKFNCSAINDPNVKNYTLRFPPSNVPTNETTYICYNFKLPNASMYDIIAFEPVIDNANILHHMLLFGCTSPPQGNWGSPYLCGMGNGANCNSMIGLWGVGGSGQCLGNQYGFRIGSGGYQYAIIQLHWSNLQRKPNLTDSSGFRIYVTTQLRPNIGAILMVGQTRLTIPPGRKDVSAMGSCTSDCTSYMSSPINITTATLHMHLLGASGYVAIYRNGKQVQMLSDNPTFSYNTPKFDEFTTPILFSPGDEVQVSCHYDSTGRNTTTNYGEGTLDEMCFGFLTYYPAMAGVSYCGQWGGMIICPNIAPMIQFKRCDFKTFLTLLSTLNSMSCADDCSDTSCAVIMNGIYATQCLAFPDVRSFLRVFMSSYVPVLSECVMAQPCKAPATDMPPVPTTSTRGYYFNQAPGHYSSYTTSILLAIIAYFNFYYLL